MLLAELQQRVRDAMIDGVPPPSSLLVGGRDPIARLAVHRRHFGSQSDERYHRSFPGDRMAGRRGEARRSGARLRPRVSTNNSAASRNTGNSSRRF